MDRHTDDLKVLQAGRKKRRIPVRFFLELFCAAGVVIAFFILCAPARTWVLTTKGNWESATGDSARALSDYESALALDSSNLDLLEKTAIMLEKSGQEERALPLFRRLLEIRGKHMVAVRHLSTISITLKQYDNALSFAEEWVKNEPENFSAWRARGRAFEALRKFDQARADYDKSIAINPHSDAVLDKEGMQRREDIMHNGFEHVTEPIFENKPNDYDATVRDAISYGRSLRMDYDRSMKEFEHAIKLKPTRPEAYVFMAGFKWRYHHYADALSDYLTCEKYWKGNEEIRLKNIADCVRAKADLYNDIAMCYAGLKQYDKALEYSSRSLTLPSQRRKSYYILRADILRHLGRTREAKEAFARAQETAAMEEPAWLLLSK